MDHILLCEKKFVFYKLLIPLIPQFLNFDLIFFDLRTSSQNFEASRAIELSERYTMSTNESFINAFTILIN